MNTGRGCWRAPTNPSFKIAEEPNTSRLGRDRRQFPLRRGVCIARRHRCLTELPTGRPSSTGPSHSRHCPLRRRKWEGRPVLIRLPLLAVHHSDITPPPPSPPHPPGRDHNSNALRQRQPAYTILRVQSTHLGRSRVPSQYTRRSRPAAEEFP